MPRLASNTNCTGCTACVSICPKNCITIQNDEYGFQIPVVTELNSCIECHLCEQICPVLHKNEVQENQLFAYAAFTQNESVRMKSSSGGLFSEFATEVLNNGGIVFGAAYDNEFRVHHIGIENKDELEQLFGAKYSQSDLDDTFKQILCELKRNREVLFSGTPCQVAGLKSFLRKDYTNLTCIDFVCHGVPSPMAWQEYVKYRAEIDNDGSLPVTINLRSKNTGWSRYRYSNVFKYDEEKEHSCLSGDSLFMKLFVGDYISRLSCEDCKFKGYNRVSDITIGDFWGIWDINQSMDDDKGTSVMILQSDKGKRMFEQIKERIVYNEVSLEETSRQNPSLLVSSRSKENREEVLNMIKQGKIGECAELFKTQKERKVGILQRIKGKIRRMFSV